MHNSYLLINKNKLFLIFLFKIKYYKIILHIYLYSINTLHLYHYNIILLKPITSYKYYKIFIKSKIYRIFSNKKKTYLFPHINYFHIIRILIFYSNVINFKKKLIIFGLSKNILLNIIQNILFYKKINIFTQRGFRVSRSVYFKKIGKISKYF